jgi:transcriptional regulator with XRE-family HTH domain
MVSTKEIFGAQLNLFRKQKNLKQSELSEILSVSTQAVGSWERGQAEPSLENLVKLAGILNCSTDLLLRGPDYISQDFLPDWVKALISSLVIMDPSEQKAVEALVRGLNILRNERLFPDSDKF